MYLCKKRKNPKRIPSKQHDANIIREIFQELNHEIIKYFEKVQIDVKDMKYSIEQVVYVYKELKQMFDSFVIKLTYSIVNKFFGEDGRRIEYIIRKAFEEWS